MGFGFLMFSGILPVLGLGLFIFVCVLLYKGKKGLGILKRILIVIGVFVACIFLLVLLASFISFINSKTKVDKDDLYGNYVIDQSKFNSTQAKWQYEHFKFTISEDNKIHLSILESNKIIKTIENDIEIVTGYSSPRLKLNLEHPEHHILQQNPTLYRDSWTFYYVFESPLYGNMFFKKTNLFGH